MVRPDPTRHRRYSAGVTPGEFPELAGQMRLVGVAVSGGGRGPVNLGLPAKVADQALHPRTLAKRLGVSPTCAVNRRRRVRGSSPRSRETPPTGAPRVKSSSSVITASGLGNTGHLPA